jgi:hypothetical protein
MKRNHLLVFPQLPLQVDLLLRLLQANRGEDFPGRRRGRGFAREERKRAENDECPMTNDE